MEREEVDKCVALESVAKQDNGKKDSTIAEPRIINHTNLHTCTYCIYIHTHTALGETMPIITLHLTCVYPLPCWMQCFSTAMDLYKLCAINKDR